VNISKVCMKFAKKVLKTFSENFLGFSRRFSMRKEKIINFIETKKRKIIGKESTSHNMGFARCGVESRVRKIFAG